MKNYGVLEVETVLLSLKYLLAFDISEAVDHSLAVGLIGVCGLTIGE